MNNSLPPILRDTFGRTVTNLRISVTDRCNFRCSYCMPEQGMTWMRKTELLTYEEITRLVTIFARVGITRIRLTGGEPLMRKDVHILVAKIRRIADIEDVALTTNGYFLAEQVHDLAQAGLNRINVSMDSLDPVVFSSLVRRDYLRKVWEGLDAIEKTSIRPIKVNVVLVRGINDREIEDFARLARTKPLVIRFIEFMPIGSDDGWTIEKVVPTREIIERINAMNGMRLVPVSRSHDASAEKIHTPEPADRYRFDDGIGEIGFISSVSEPFCSSCNRVRITSDGKLRTCLFSLHETNLKELLRSDAHDDEIQRTLLAAVWNKEEGHLINRPGFIRPARTMSQIGG